MDGLTPRQARFVAEYLIDLNATAAYRRAGYQVKNDNVASVNSHNLLRKPKIVTAIAAAQKTQQERTELTADFVLNGLVVEAKRTGQGSQHGARVRAYELLGKHLGLIVDKLAPTTPDGKDPWPGPRGGELARGVMGNERAAEYADRMLDCLGEGGADPAPLLGRNGAGSTNGTHPPEGAEPFPP